MRVGVIAIVLVGTLHSGCDMLRSAEEQCLQSSRLRFKDPDALAVVENLGQRGEPVQSDSFWLRYKAKNSYGAFDSANMACTKLEGKWIRDFSRESQALSRVVHEYMDSQINELQKGIEVMAACKTKRCVKENLTAEDRFSPDQRARRAAEQSVIYANKRIFESIEPLTSGVNGPQ